MKKIDLIHTAILIVAILAAYAAIQYTIGLLSILAFLGDGAMFKQASEQFIYTIIPIVAFTAACIILVKNGRKYATLILKDDPEGSWEDAPKWDLDRRNILLALFIGMGLHMLIQSIPSLLTDLYDIFSDKVHSYMLEGPGKKGSLIPDLLKTTIGAVLIYASPALTNFIDRSIAVRLDHKDSGS